MILTCPQCETRFMLPADRLGREGSNVKCSSCGKVWHQDPDPDEFADDEIDQDEPEEFEDYEQEDDEIDQAEEADADDEYDNKLEEPEDDYGDEEELEEPEEPDHDDIPRGVMPDSEDASASDNQKAEKEKISLRAMMGGFAAAALVFVISFAVIYFAHNSIVSKWPASRALYEMLGIDVPVPGEGLVFDKLAVKVSSSGSGTEKISIDGQIVNLTAHDQVVPPIEISLKDDHDKILEKWIFEAPEKKLNAEGTMSFSSEHDAHKNNAKNVHLRFVLKAEEAEASHEEEKTEAHHEEKTHDDHGAVSASHH